MSERLFLYIDILGFKNLIQSGYDIMSIYNRIDRLNVHSDEDFHAIVFSDTIVVYSEEFWLQHPSQGLMWLIEFAQDLFYNLISLDIHIRAYITRGDFQHHKLKNIEAYFGSALVTCHEREKNIKCTGVFLDSELAKYSNIFYLTRYNSDCYYVHVMQHLDDVSQPYSAYPLDGRELEATGMEWWTAYLLRYLQNIHGHARNPALPDSVKEKYSNAWKMIADRHNGLCKRLEEAKFNFGKVIQLDWTDKFLRIGTDKGAFG